MGGPELGVRERTLVGVKASERVGPWTVAERAGLGVSVLERRGVVEPLAWALAVPRAVAVAREVLLAAGVSVGARGVAVAKRGVPVVRGALTEGEEEAVEMALGLASESVEVGVGVVRGDPEADAVTLGVPVPRRLEDAERDAAAVAEASDVPENAGESEGEKEAPALPDEDALRDALPLPLALLEVDGEALAEVLGCAVAEARSVTLALPECEATSGVAVRVAALVREARAVGVPAAAAVSGDAVGARGVPVNGSRDAVALNVRVAASGGEGVAERLGSMGVAVAAEVALACDWEGRGVAVLLMGVALEDSVPPSPAEGLKLGVMVPPVVALPVGVPPPAGLCVDAAVAREEGEPWPVLVGAALVGEARALCVAAAGDGVTPAEPVREASAVAVGGRGVSLG